MRRGYGRRRQRCNLPGSEDRVRCFRPAHAPPAAVRVVPRRPFRYDGGERKIKICCMSACVSVGRPGARRRMSSRTVSCRIGPFSAACAPHVPRPADGRPTAVRARLSAARRTLIDRRCGYRTGSRVRQSTRPVHIALRAESSMHPTSGRSRRPVGWLAARANERTGGGGQGIGGSGGGPVLE